MIDYDIESQLVPNLDASERLVWAGKPKSGVIFRSLDIFMIPFSILWGGFAIFWEVLAASGPFFFWIFWYPFCYCGLAFNDRQVFCRCEETGKHLLWHH